MLMGDSGKGPVIPGQVQGVKQGVGVLIALDGTISFDSDSALGVVKTNNTSAYNSYKWPNAPVVGGQLVLGVSDTLYWGRIPGYGLLESSSNLRVQTPIATTPPAIGTGNSQAPEGGLYWNSESGVLFISSGGTWVQASYGPADLNKALLTGTYTLYVNPEIGSDEFITGIYDPLATPVVTNQMTVAGYSAQRPFKTIARAALEVARIQNGAVFDSDLFDRFVIKCSVGIHVVDNGLGTPTVTAWTDGYIPSSSDLMKMNSTSYAGVILPRGVSVIGEDLRKTVIRPSYVPAKAGDIENDRGSIFRITGGGFFFNFTFKDEESLNESHHLLDCFSFVSDTDLNAYYDKVQDLFTQSYPDLQVNPGETEIVAPQPPGTPEESTDGVFGSSPYIFNCSIRSKYGLCGINADGSDVSGFKSIVTAQFTGVSLQRDLTCWQKYNPGPKTWTTDIANYDEYIGLDPNNVRMRPDRKSFHIRAVNNAFIQEVSVFAIGQGVHHWVSSGGELSITNSNSSFGGCAAIAEGYKTEAFPQDSNWDVGTINVATNLTDQETVVNIIEIGTVSVGQVNNSTTIILDAPLVESEIYAGQPQILASRNYTFKEDSYLWIENSEGLAWRAPLDASAWSTANPANVEITVAMENQDGDQPGIAGQPDLEGSRVFIRRLIDSRTQAQRRYSLNITNTDSNVRSPLRDYVIQTTIGGSVVDLLPESDMVIVNKSGPIPIGSDPVAKKSQVVLQRSNAVKDWTAGEYYRTGETVRYENKHFTCIIKNFDSVFDPEKWNESYVHMASDYNAYDFFLNTAPVVYFDNDTDDEVGTIDCGYNLATCWTTDSEINGQYITATDYRGVYQFLIGIGFSEAEVDDLLVPTPTADRELDPSSSVDMMGYVPSGAANALAHWEIEFRRPSIVRMFGHAWEWSGFLNYTKALPVYQGDLSAQNQFTYYFTNQLGGRVYATGFNQEGYFVTAAGLTDLSTNATLSVSDLGNPFAGVDVPAYFPELTVDNLRITTTQKYASGTQISGAPLFAAEWYNNFRVASQTLTGITRYATNAETAAGTATDVAISPATLAYALTSSVTGFPAGTRLSFNNVVPPTGWILETNSLFDGAAIRVLNTSGGGYGGTVPFTNAFGGAVTTGAHTLTITEMPSHFHDFFGIQNTSPGGPFGSTNGAFPQGYDLETSNVGGGGAHDHSLNIGVKYVDFIVATKS